MATPAGAEHPLEDGGSANHADDFCWDGLADQDEFLPIDSGEDDPVRLQAVFDRDQDEYDSVLESDAGASGGRQAAPPDEFARELIDFGPDAAAAILGSMEPGPETAAMLAMLRPAVLTPASMVSVVAATEKLLSWVQARQHRWIAAFACPDVVASRRALTQYASQPGQPLHASSSTAPEHRRRRDQERDDVHGCSASAVHGDHDVEIVLTEVALNVAAAEIGAALHFTPVTSKRRVCQAVDYAVDLPATLTAMEAGTIDRGRAGVIADRTQNLPVDLRRRVERSVLPKATSRTSGQVRGIVDRAVISVDPEAAKKRHERAISERNVSYRAAEDGIGVFRAELSADRAQVAYGVIDQIADQLKRAPSTDGVTDDRGIGALRADVFGDLFDQLACTGTITLHDTFMRRAATAPSGCADATDRSRGESAGATSGVAGHSADADIADGPRGESAGAMSDLVGRSADAEVAVGALGEWDGARSDAAGRSEDAALEDAADGPQAEQRTAISDATRHLGSHHGRHTHLNVTIAESTLAGRDQRPGELEGHGPIPADLARAIALSAETITAIAIRPGCGSGLDLGRTSYRPRLAQRDHVTTRDQTCRFPGCRRDAKRCQLDHSDEFCPGRKDGGVTCPCNLCCLCAFHHGLKTGGLWDSVQHLDASITWTSPTGREYTTYPREWPTEHYDEPIATENKRVIEADIPPVENTTDSISPDHGIDDEPPF